jgi:hypothetical protein
VGSDACENILPMSERSKTGTFLGVPYDWRRPTVARLKSRWWNPEDPRLLTPRWFGWGWDINVARLLGRKPKP